MDPIVFSLIVIVVVLAAIAYRKFSASVRPIPAALQPGQPFPEFQLLDENDAPVHSSDLLGRATVLLFVRGNWCPFCSSQVENLSVHYKDIVDMGARLILVTPKPLETTRRVAEFFDVEFDFWLDEDLAVARQLGLVHAAGVPASHRKEYGTDTIWPTAVVVDPSGIIRFTELSKFLADRPNPKTLVRELRLAL